MLLVALDPVDFSPTDALVVSPVWLSPPAVAGRWVSSPRNRGWVGSDRGGLPLLPVEGVGIVRALPASLFKLSVDLLACTVVLMGRREALLAERSPWRSEGSMRFPG